ncbi:MAG: hypothetical protein FLDDKLPJ_00393 [Phycisphaerae bacterium]|nr:hypothetical protein [Phycisphaerae bacterium]
MDAIAAIWAKAESDLVIPNARGGRDRLLWEHTVSVTRASQRVAALPAVSRRNPDPVILTVASLYHDAAYAVDHHGAGFVDVDCITRAGDGAIRDRSAEVALDRLQGLLEPGVLSGVADVIRETGQRECRRVESQIIRDADNLYQLGLLTLWPLIRQSAATGQGPGDLILRWRTWKAYDYLPARRTTFFFEDVQRLAEERMRVFDRFVDDLGREFEGADLALPVVNNPVSADPASPG